MTVLRLLLWIVFGITLQLGVFLGVAFWRHWREFMALKTGLVAAPGDPAWSEPLGGPATWPGILGWLSALPGGAQGHRGSDRVDSFLLSRIRRRAAPAQVQTGSIPDFPPGSSRSHGGAWNRSRVVTPCPTLPPRITSGSRLSAPPRRQRTHGFPVAPRITFMITSRAAVTCRSARRPGPSRVGMSQGASPGV